VAHSEPQFLQIFITLHSHLSNKLDAAREILLGILELIVDSDVSLEQAILPPYHPRLVDPTEDPEDAGLVAVEPVAVDYALLALVYVAHNYLPVVG
jgi:hypothetical protein